MNGQKSDLQFWSGFHGWGLKFFCLFFCSRNLPIQRRTRQKKNRDTCFFFSPYFQQIHFLHLFGMRAQVKCATTFLVGSRVVEIFNSFATVESLVTISPLRTNLWPARKGQKKKGEKKKRRLRKSPAWIETCPAHSRSLPGGPEINNAVLETDSSCVDVYPWKHHWFAEKRLEERGLVCLKNKVFRFHSDLRSKSRWGRGSIKKIIIKKIKNPKKDSINL